MDRQRHSLTYRQDCDLVSPLSFFETRLKMYIFECNKVCGIFIPRCRSWLIFIFHQRILIYALLETRQMANLRLFPSILQHLQCDGFTSNYFVGLASLLPYPCLAQNGLYVPVVNKMKKPIKGIPSLNLFVWRLFIQGHCTCVCVMWKRYILGEMSLCCLRHCIILKNFIQ
jgi:hypothetical protein